MPRPLKAGLDYFPIWNPQVITVSKFNRSDFRVRYKALRNSSSAFIKRKDVREILFTKYNYSCTNCGSKNNLEIDHIISVYLCALGKLNIDKLNTLSNLTVLCKTCNCRRVPNE